MVQSQNNQVTYFALPTRISPERPQGRILGSRILISKKVSDLYEPNYYYCTIFWGGFSDLYIHLWIFNLRYLAGLGQAPIKSCDIILPFMGGPSASDRQQATGSFILLPHRCRRSLYWVGHLAENPTLDWHPFVNGEPDTWVYANAVVAMQRQDGRVKARSVYEYKLERSALIPMSVILCTCPTGSMSRLLSSGTRQYQYHKQKECMHFSFQDNR